MMELTYERLIAQEREQELCRPGTHWYEWRIELVGDELGQETSNYVDYERYDGRRRKRGHELVVGDFMKMRLDGGWKRVASLEPYEGALLELLGEGTRIVRFDGGSGITVCPNDRWEVA
jgi:hypothetical protein